MMMMMRRRRRRRKKKKTKDACSWHSALLSSRLFVRFIRRALSLSFLSFFLPSLLPAIVLLFSADRARLSVGDTMGRCFSSTASFTA